MKFFPAIVATILGTVVSLLVIVWILLSRLPKPKFLQEGAARNRQLHHTHQAPVPRIGGLAFAAALLVLFVASFLLVPTSNPVELQTRFAFAASCLTMFLVGFCDDLKPLGARKKLLAQLAIATLTYAAGIQITTFKNPISGVIYQLGWWGLPVTVLWLVALTNLMNLVDGIDGLAGGIGLLLMGLVAIVGLVFHGEVSFVTVLAAGLCGCLVSFLCYNFPPASIFMGDGGAYLLGYMIGTLTIISSQKGTIVAALIAPLFALALPILDVSIAILRRGLQGLPIFRADRKHLHHRLLQVGYTRTKTVLILYGVSLIFLVFALTIVWSQGSWIAFTLGMAGLVVLFLGRTFRFSREWFAVGRVVGNSLEMRKEIHYALALTRWLELGAERAATFESLWEDFLFAANKLGFSQVTVFWGDQENSWSKDDTGGPQHRLSFETHAVPGSAISFAAAQDSMHEKSFAIKSEILAECWLKIVKSFERQAAKSSAYVSDDRSVRQSPLLQPEQPGAKPSNA